MKKLLFVALLGLFYSISLAQDGLIKGKVTDELTNDPVAFANVVIQGQTTGTTTNLDGNYELTGLEPGLYNLEVSFLGYQTKVLFEIQVTKNRSALVDVKLAESTEQLEEVVVQTSAFERSIESPVSVRSIGTNEIQRYPGGNRDISKVIQSLPGVASTVSFRNDIIIRGGAPNENRFYLDGIEVPVINHFSTQGASGGPVGMINVDFIKNVEFYTGAFPANRGNTLSSLMEFDLIDGRSDRLAATFTVGASEIGASLQGPLTKKKKSTFILSIRPSYLQFLFQLLELPFLPVYNDIQFKTAIEINEKSDLTILGLGAYDNFDLNLDANETDDQRFLLGTLPEQIQWNYTIGAKYRRFLDNGYIIVVASRNHLDNEAFKYADNDKSSEDNLILNYRSQEIENKLRFEHTTRKAGFKINYGVAYEFVQYTNTTETIVTNIDGNIPVNFSSDVNFNKYGFFAQVSKGFFSDRWKVSLGFRADGNDYNGEMANPFKQFSPRLSSSVAITDFMNWNSNIGIYYQLPPYTTLGFRDNSGTLVNQNRLDYISSTHFVTGFDLTTKFNAQFAVEGFFKLYQDYPFLLNDSITLANLGGDFGVIGNEPASSQSDGRAYGVELFYQQKLFKGFFGIISYTFVRSEFQDKNGDYVPTTWDNRHLVSLTFGKKFKRNWEIGLRWRLLGGTPFTPFDQDFSSIVGNWNQNGRALPNYDLLNTERLKTAHQLDVRVDKKWFFERWSLNVYLDIQNAYNLEYQLQPNVTLDLDANNEPVILNPNAPEGEQRYRTKLIDNPAGTLIPSIGIIVEL